MTLCSYVIIYYSIDINDNLFSESKRKQAIAAANELTQALVEHLNLR